MYEKDLQDIPQIKTVIHNPDCNSSRHLFQIRVDDREELLQYLYSHEIYPGVHYKSNKEYPMYKDCKGDTPRANSYQHQIISLPLHVGLTTSDVMIVCNLIRAYYVK